MWEVRDEKGRLVALPFYSMNMAYKVYDENDGFKKGWTVKPSIEEDKGED